MSDPKNTLLLEYLNLSDVQRSFYFNSRPDLEEEVESRFFYSPKKVSWSTSIQLPLLLQREGFDYVYVPDNNFHLLAWTCLIWKLPKISVKAEHSNKVEIRWVENLAISIVKEAHLYFGNKRIQSFDHFCSCIFHKFLMRDSQKGKFSEMIGNRGNLTNWSNTLESDIIIFPQFWYYSKDEVHAFPLFLCKTKSLKHKYIFRNKIHELLRMRILTAENQWKELQDVNISYLEVEQDMLPPPEMLGKYINLSEEEYEFRKESKVEYFLNDFVKFTEENPKRASDFVSFDINIPEPCQCIFFMAENVNNAKLRKYTEFHGQSENNKTPFSIVKLMYGTSEKIAEREIEVLDFIESFYHFPSCKEMYKGCHGISLCYDLYSPDADTSIVFRNLSAKLLFRLKENIEGLYKVRLYLYIIKKLEIQKDDCNIYPDLLFLTNK